MRTLLALLIIAGAAYFFFISKDEDVAPRGSWVRETSRSSGMRESAPEPSAPGRPAVAIADGGRLTLSLGNGDGTARPRASDAQRAKVEGRVLDAHGEPLAGVPIAVPGLPSAKSERAPRIVSDAQGEFAFETDAPALELASADPQWTVLAGNVESGSGGAWQAQLVAARLVRCQGTVTDPAGRRLPGVDVHLHGKIELEELGGRQRDFERRTQSDEQGRFDAGFVPLLEPTVIEFELAGHDSVILEVPAEERALTVALRPK